MTNRSPLRIRRLASLADVVTALATTIRALSDGRIDVKRGTAVIYGLSVARQVVEARDAEARRAAGQPDGLPVIGGVVVVPGTATDMDDYLRRLRDQQTAIVKFAREQSVLINGGDDES